MRILKIKMLMLAAAAIFLSGCAPMDDVTFARTAMERLIEGHYTARPMFDWSRLKFAGFDIGKEYAQFKQETEKANYERTVITNFSSSYKRQGATKKAFFNWKLFKDYEAKEPGLTVVTANCNNENTTFAYAIKHEKGKKKIVEVVLFVKPRGVQAADEKK